MKIKMDELKKYVKLLKEIPFNPIEDNKFTLFFEVDCGKRIENDGFILDVKQSEERGAAGFVKTGLILSHGEKGTQISLAYIQSDYCPKFNLDSYLDLVKSSCSKPSRAKLIELDCLLVKSQYILAEFELK